LLGNKVEPVHTGLFLDGTELVLTFDSATAIRPQWPDNITTLFEIPSFGDYWRSNFHHRLQPAIAPLIATAPLRAMLSRGDGRVLSFIGDGSGNFVPDGYNANKLETITGGYRFTDIKTGDIEQYNSTGLLTSIAKPNGRTFSFTYSGDALLSVQGDDGRSLSFVYNAGRIVKIIGPASEVINVQYDPTGNMTGLTWPDGLTKFFMYEDTSHPWALTGVIDEDFSRYSTFAYDSGSHAISTTHRSGADNYSVSYSTPPTWVVNSTVDRANGVIYRIHSIQPPQGTVLQVPNGTSVSMDSQDVLGQPSITTRSQSAGSGSAPATSTVAYDSIGNVQMRDDFDGARTCFLHDQRRLELTRVEGLSTSADCQTVVADGATLPAGARKVTTQWHPDLALAEVVTEPLRRTTSVYQGRPDPFNANSIASCSSAPLRSDGKPLPLLCKQVVQALRADGSVDTSAPTVTTSYAYDVSGRLLSKTDPDGNLTTYAYYPDTSFTGLDSNLGSVVLLLHGNGSNGSTTIVDSSLSQRAFTLAGNVQISSAQSMFGGSSIAFDGSGDYLSIPYSSDFAFGSGDFTIETYLYKNGNNANWSRIWNPNGDSYDGVNMGIDPSGNFGVYASTNCTSWTYSLPTVANLANGQWYHLAFVRKGGSLLAFVNGTMYTVATGLGTTALCTDTTDGRVIGGQAGTDRALNGYIDEFRITKGVARYTANFTPPAQQFADTNPDMTAIGHTIGDLQSVTNAAHQTTQYTAYDPSGRLRQSVDAKGITTDYVYTLRGKLSTVTVTPPGGSARTTTYGYDDVGQLRGVALPNGTNLGYGYDPAHRLIWFSDVRGNSIGYTLDSSGNRTNEEVRDRSGTLQRSVSRVFDALDRVQQVTGSDR
jgi:YD repeat-containing protein